MAKLTDKQKKFCDEYLTDFNATQAAIRAGYSEKTANRIASENLSKPDIQNYIAELKKDSQKRSEIKRGEVIQELKKIGFADIEIETLKPSDKIKALEIIARMLGYDKPEEGNNMDAVNKNIKALAELINNPKPNRSIKDFEDNE